MHIELSSNQQEYIADIMAVKGLQSPDEVISNIIDNEINRNSAWRIHTEQAVAEGEAQIAAGHGIEYQPGMFTQRLDRIIEEQSKLGPLKP